VDIEQIATSKVEESISKAEKLKAYVSANDKGPSFDGYIGIFNRSDFSKRNFKRVNVQIKGKKVKKIPESTNIQYLLLI
jgi:hypothetical protein